MMLIKQKTFANDTSQKSANEVVTSKLNGASGGIGVTSKDTLKVTG